MWISGYSDLEVYDGVRVVHVPPPVGATKIDHGEQVLQACQNVAEDAAGDIWLIASQSGRLSPICGGRWQLNGGLKDLPAGPSIRVTADDRGRIWLGYPNDRIATIDHDRVTLYGPEEGLCHRQRAESVRTRLACLGSRR